VLPACTSGADRGPVEVLEPPVRGDDVEAVCAALLEALPAEVDPGVERREVTPQTGRTAAWGDPPVVLECGVAAPERAEPPQFVNRVGWTIRDVGPGFRWTTSDRTVRIAVTVPDEYDGGNVLLPLSTAVTDAVPRDPAAPDPLDPTAPGVLDPPVLEPQS
jgi:hypothetical protein